MVELLFVHIAYFISSVKRRIARLDNFWLGRACTSMLPNIWPHAETAVTTVQSGTKAQSVDVRNTFNETTASLSGRCTYSTE